MKKGKIGKILEMPEEVCSNIPKITITGFNELILENYKGILEYEVMRARWSVSYRPEVTASISWPTAVIEG